MRRQNTNFKIQNLDHLSFSIPNVDSICQENELIRQGVQQLQNKINQFQKRDGLGGSPLLRVKKLKFKRSKIFEISLFKFNLRPINIHNFFIKQKTNYIR